MNSTQRAEDHRDTSFVSGLHTLPLHHTTSCSTCASWQPTENSTCIVWNNEPISGRILDTQHGKLIQECDFNTVHVCSSPLSTPNLPQHYYMYLHALWWILILNFNLIKSNCIIRSFCSQGLYNWNFEFRRSKCNVPSLTNKYQYEKL